MILQCLEQTKHMRKNQDTGGKKNIFHILTDLEKTFELLLKKTYEFRIKAG